MSDRNIINMEDDILVTECSPDQVKNIVEIIIGTTNDSEMKVGLIDVQGRFDCFDNDPHVVGRPIKDIHNIESFFVWLNEEISDRLRKIGSSGYKNLDQYNKAYPEEKMPFITVIAHELTDMNINSNKELLKALLNDDNAGVYFIMCSEHSAEDLNIGASMNMLKTMDLKELIDIIK